ncbi:MAG: PAS domain-containing protein [Kiloniellaceae bacterium]
MVEPKEPQLRELLAYWQNKRGPRLMPRRADVDPIEIPHLLPHLILVDTGQTLGEFRYRLFGTEVCKGFEHDRTGVRFSDLPRIPNYDEIYGGYWRTYVDRKPVYFHGQIVSASRDYIRYSRLTLPLSVDGEHVDMLLGGVVFSYESAERDGPGSDIRG